MTEIVFTVFFIFIIYLMYQLLRNKKVYDIRCKWSFEDDSRWRRYDYDEMFDPSRKNNYGLKWPKDNHYK